MGVINQNFDNAFGRNSGRNAVAKDDQPKAQYWLNIGYTIDVQLLMTDGPDEGKLVTETRFVSLPVGIPLDTMKLLPTNQTNEDFAGFQAARNDLHEQIMEVCKTLEHGEEKIIGLNDGNGLSIQLRRVKEEKAPIKAADNVFSKRLAFA